MLQKFCAYDYDDKEDKEDLIKIEAIPSGVSDSSGDGYVVRVSFCEILSEIQYTMTP